jgi:hypothetical protein
LRAFITHSRSKEGIIMYSSRLSFFRALLGVALLFAASMSHAVLIYGLRSKEAGGQQIVSFRVDSPTAIRTTTDVVGLASGEFLVGLTFRPETGQLYSLAKSSSGARLVVVDPRSGVIAQIGAGGLPYLGDNVSYNPVSDRIRVFDYIIDGSFIVGTKNYSIGTGGSLLTHADLTYAGSGAVPLPNALAHTYPHSDALVTTLYAIDPYSDTLMRIGNMDDTPSPNGGVATSIGPLGVPVSSASMAIAPRSNEAYAAIGFVNAALYRINLSNGAATFISNIGVPSGGTDARISAIAIPDQNKCFDLDGDGKILPTSDGLMLLRAMLGFTGTSVTANAIPPGPHPASSLPIRTTWIAVRNHLNERCGMDFAP